MKRIFLNLLGVLAFYSACKLQLVSTLAQGIAFTTLTITNPTPAVFDTFGFSVASVGTDRVLIGAPNDDTGAMNSGAAYLFSTNGTLLITFTNPTPAVGDAFGFSVAGVGTNRLLISANTDSGGAGAVYLFNASGALLTTFTNPTPASSFNFGISVAAVGTDRVLIGSPFNDTGATDAGAAYLFNTNGSLFTTFTNPTPAINDRFGYAVAAMGADRVLIGAYQDDTGATDAGATYLFSTNGTLLTTFTNPTPETSDGFGISMTAIGTDRILIGAWSDNTVSNDAGAAYLFNTNGTLLTTITNPTPGVGDLFGHSVAAVGTDRFLIGAHNDRTSGTFAGSTYLFDVNGTLLTTITNPAPAAGDFFGYSVTAVGSDQVLIGTYQDDTGATDAGSAYLFSLTSLPLLLSLSYNAELSTTTLSWPVPTENWLLERNNALPALTDGSWQQVPPPYQTNAGKILMTLTNDPATESQFFRLHKQ